jgi:AmiR/NasT family two-component response regulator
VLDDITTTDPARYARQIGTELAPAARQHLMDARRADGALPSGCREAIDEALRCIELLEEQVGHLEKALQNRIVIEQAKGILAARTGDRVDDMFEVLRRRSQLQNRKLRDVAAHVVDTLGSDAAG